MRHGRFAAACALAAVLMASTAQAALITTGGEWSPLGAGSETGPRWFDNPSWDGPDKAAVYLWLQGEPWEYLHATGDPNAPQAFGWDGEALGWTWELGITAQTDGAMSRDAGTGELLWTSGIGPRSSFVSLGNFLLARLREPGGYLWMVPTEDIDQMNALRECFTDPQRYCGDLNDGRASWRSVDAGGPGGGSGGGNVPEPVSGALTALGVGIYAGRQRWSSRQARRLSR